MAVEWILTQGIGFNPTNVRYIPTLGFTPIASTTVGTVPDVFLPARSFTVTLKPVRK